MYKNWSSTCSIRGWKTVIDQSVDSGSKVLPGERLLLLTDSDKIYMPDTTTWSKADLGSQIGQHVGC